MSYSFMFPAPCPAISSVRCSFRLCVDLGSPPNCRLPETTWTRVPKHVHTLPVSLYHHLALVISFWSRDTLWFYYHHCFPFATVF